MSVSYKTHWDQFLQSVKKQTSSIAFENWIAPIQFLKEEEEAIFLQVPNIFVQEYLLENYKRDLSALFPVQTNGEPAVQFVVQTEAPSKNALEFPTSTLNLAAQAHFSKSTSLLNERYTFENFIEGKHNQFAKSAAIQAVSNRASHYNPLFIYGEVGVGKTHLLHAMSHYLQKKNRNIPIQCITTEFFVNHLVEHLREKSLGEMKRKYRSLRILLLDDIQILQNRNFEEELLHTFESLIRQKSQVVITSDISPDDLNLSARIKDRMEWGLICQITAPDLETRAAILQDKAEKRNILLDQELIFFIAEHVQGSIRLLEGVVNKLSAYSHLLQKKIDHDLVAHVLPKMDLCTKEEQKVRVHHIFSLIERSFQIDQRLLCGEGRKKEVAKARQIAMYLAKKWIQAPLVSIASQFNRKHSTLIHAHHQIVKEMNKDSSFQKEIEKLEENLFGPECER